MKAAILLASALLASAFEVQLTPVPAPRHFSWGSSPLEEHRLIGESQLRNGMNMQYSGRFHIGTPPQSFSLIFDTGSSWTWVNNINCVLCHSSFRFDPSLSSTAVELNVSKSLRYGRGQLYGRVLNETVSLSPLEDRVENQAIILVSANKDFDGMEADGILGLAFAKGSNRYATFVDNLKSQGLIDRAMFAMYLSDSDKPQFGKPSSISFGSYDLEKYALSNFTYVNVLSESGMWFVNMTTFSIGYVSHVRAYPALIDSGTSLLICPQEAFDIMQVVICAKYECIDYSDIVVFSCSREDIANLPEFSFTLDGHTFTLPGYAYTFFYEYEELCVVGMTAMSFDAWILGDVFMRHYYSLFDMDNFVIGLAHSANSRDVRVMAYSEKTEWSWIITTAALVSAAAGLWAVARKKKVESLCEPLLENYS